MKFQLTSTKADRSWEKPSAVNPWRILASETAGHNSPTCSSCLCSRPDAFLPRARSSMVVAKDNAPASYDSHVQARARERKCWTHA